MRKGLSFDGDDLVCRITYPRESKHAHHKIIFPRYLISAILLASAALLAAAPLGIGQSSGVREQPYLGWSSFGQQTISRNFLTQGNVTAQSDALLSSGLQAHGFLYINIDSGWQGGFDSYGRPIPDPTTFPDISSLAAHIHDNGQKVGIYWVPGVEEPAVLRNLPILGTPYHIQDILVVPYTAGNAFGRPGTSPYHYKIDFTKPGAQEYINSVVSLFASWGMDLIKLDGVTPGSDVDNLTINNIPDVEAWSAAIAESGRPMWLTLSWALDEDYLSIWQQFANARRIEGDVECEGACTTLTDWARVQLRFNDLVGWENASGVSLGWNDLDSLDVGNGRVDGLTHDEQQSAVTLWAMANAPMYIGGDLTRLHEFGTHLLSNEEVIAVQQSGHPAKQILGGVTPVWAADLGDGTLYVAIFNLNAFPSRVTVPWSNLGFAHATQVRDLWTHQDLREVRRGFSAVLVGHGVRLLKVWAKGFVPLHTLRSRSYEAEDATLSGTAVIAACQACSGAEKAGYLGNGPDNNVTFPNVTVRHGGTYLMEVDYLTAGPRSFVFRVNGGALQTLNLGGGSFNVPASTTVPVQLNRGSNAIQFGNPATYAPDLDRIAIRGDGSAVAPTSDTYEAEDAALAGTARVSVCSLCSGGAKAGNIGGDSANTVAFTNVTVPTDGTYQMELDYMTNGPRSFFISINGSDSVQLNLNGSSFSSPVSTVIAVQLHAGSNTIQLGNPDGYAPDLDRIAIARTTQLSEHAAREWRTHGAVAKTVRSCLDLGT